MSMNFPFPVQQQLTSIALAYRNANYIADEVLPRTPVPSREFKWQQFERDELFTVPETQVGRKGEPNEVQFSGTEVASFVQDYGLDDVVPNVDIESAPPGYDPIGRAVEGIAELVALDRERRTANIVTALATYPTANRTTLTGTGQWSDFANSDPYTAMMTAFDGMLMRPNTLVMGRRVYSRLRVHPRITAALAPSANGNSATTSAAGRPATAQALAELLEVDRVIIGESWVNTAKPGQTASMQRVWGNHVAALHLNPAASIRGNAITFGFTAEWGGRVAGSMPEPKTGLRGAQRVRAGESLRELVVASDVGFLWRDAVA
jgi:hypothetical protein